MLNDRPLASGFGGVLEARSEGQSLLDLDSTQVLDTFTRLGAVLFRGFQVTEDGFRALTDRFGEGAVVARSYDQRKSVSADGSTQTVNTGRYQIPPHAEMGWSPRRPELMWFHCVRPARQGGETLLCDGRDVWSTLPPVLKEAFLARRVKYVHDLELRELPLLGLPADVALVAEMVKLIPDVTFQQLDSNSARIEYFVSPRERPVEFVLFLVSMITFFSLPAIADGMNLNRAVKAERVRFDDDSPVDRGMLDQVLAHALDRAIDVQWEPGDVLMFDNYRLLHGRRAFPDETERQVHVRMNWSLRRPPAA